MSNTIVGIFRSPARGPPPRLEARRLELRAKGERVDDHREHPHVVGGRAVDAVLRGVRAAQPVAAADDDRYLRADRLDLADLLREVRGVLRRDAELAVSEQRFARQLQEDAVVLRGPADVGHAASPSWKRAIRRTLMCSPVAAASAVTRS